MFRDIILVFSGLAVLIVGVLYPQEKNTIYGIPWTWFFIWYGMVLIISLRLINSSNLRIPSFFLLYFSLIFFIILSSATFISDYKVDQFHFFDVFSVLILTTLTSYFLISGVRPDRFFYLADKFCLTLCFFLLLFRLVEFDFSREGSFLGLGPLTFIKYVSLGVLIRLIYLKKFSLIAVFLYGSAYLISDSRGPLIYVFIVYSIYLVLSLRGFSIRNISFRNLSLGIVVFALFISYAMNNARLATSFQEIPLAFIDSSDLSVTDDDVAREEVSSIIVRLVAFAESIEILQENPFFGIGPGQWPNKTQMQSIDYPHNSLLEIWTEYGIFVLAIFLYLVWLVIKNILKGNVYGYLALFCFFTTLTSGGARDLRFFLLFALLTIFVSVFYKNTSKIKQGKRRINFG